MFGSLSGCTDQYWTITIVDYVVNLLAVPLLALAGHCQVAALLMIAERTGKAICTPTCDAMLSHATHWTVLQEMGLCAKFVIGNETLKLNLFFGEALPLQAQTWGKCEVKWRPINIFHELCA